MAESSTNGKPTGHEAAVVDLPSAVTTHESGDDDDAPAVAASEGDADVLAVGAKVGRYLVVERLGAGAMGVVYAAYDPKLDRKVALKLLRPRAGGDRARRTARLEREAQGLAKLSHPNVVGIFDVGVHDEQVFLAMEFLGGGTLRAWLETVRPWREVLAMFTAVGRGLAAAHAEGLIHRDFKPDNVLLDKAGNPKVVDFGLVRLTRMGDASEGDSGEGAAPDAEDDDVAASGGAPALTRTGAMTGTPAYMAAEQFLGRPMDARTDQFAFCVSLYEALWGERPFAGATLLRLADAVTTGHLREAPRDTTVPTWLRRVVVRGLGPRPDTRWPSMGALIAALEDDPAVKARRRLIVGGTIAVVVATVLGAAQVVRHRHAQTEAEIARNVGDSEREASSARAKAAEAKSLRARAFTAFDAMEREAGETLWRQSRGLIPTIDTAFDRAAAALEVALTLDGARGDLRARLAGLHHEHILFAEEARLESKAQVLVERLAAADLDGSKRKALAAEGAFELRVHPASRPRVVLERFDRDATSGRRIVTQVAALNAEWSVSPLPAGSYRALLSGQGQAEVAFPFALQRGERLSVDVAMPAAAVVPKGFVYVPPGAFWFGDGDELLRTQFLGTVPIHRRTTGAYLIAKNETTYGEWIQFLESLPPRQQEQSLPDVSVTTRGSLRMRKLEGEGAGTGAGGGRWQLTFQPTTTRYTARSGEPVLYDGRTTLARQDWLRFPVAGISLADANNYLRWLRDTGKVPGARLCSEVEWERAARGADDRLFPHGDELAPADANIDVTYGRVNSAYGPDQVGAHPQSRSPFGVDDLAGNAFELVLSSLKSDELVIRGGAYFFQSINARVTNREVVPASYRDVMAGIRVCATVKEEP
jgi:formylglycine-generating enzyme required for sulfatase activity